MLRFTRTKSCWARSGGGVLVAAVLVAACFAPGAQAGGGGGHSRRPATSAGLSQAQRHNNDISSGFQHLQRFTQGQKPHALTTIKTDDQSAPTPSPPTPTPNSHRCAVHTDCADGDYCRQAVGGPVCSDCVDYRNYRCDDWQDSIDGQCTVCDHANASPPRSQALNRKQTQQHREQYQQPQRQAHNRAYHDGGTHNHHEHHHHSDQAAEQDSLRSGSDGDKRVRNLVGNMLWGCLMTSLFIFGTNCVFWFLCSISTFIMWAINPLSCRCSSTRMALAPIATVCMYDEDAALQAALVASLLSSAQQATSQPQQQEQQAQDPASGVTARCVSDGLDGGCCIPRCFGRLLMLPVFVMSLCCPLCMLISAAFLFSSFSGKCCGSNGHCCSSPCSISRRFDGRGVSGPRFRCGGTTAEAAPAPAAALLQKTQQKQSNGCTIVGTSAPAAPQAESAAPMGPLLQEVVGEGDADEEDAILQCAVSPSLSQQPAEPEPEPEPEKEHDPGVHTAQPSDQKTEQEGEGECVAAGFVEVVMDSDE